MGEELHVVVPLTTRLSRSAALDAVSGRLRCPVCGDGLSLGDTTLSCAAGHSYDVARQGHVSLPAPGRRARPAGDSEDMVAARDAFLGGGHYARIVDAVSAAAAAGVQERGVRAGCVVDLGAGTGHYLAGVLRRLDGWSGLALDASRSALRRAVQADPRIAGVVCDAWSGLPVRDGGADVVLSVFAPRNAAEIARILAPSGTLVVVTPAEEHLGELVSALGMIGVGPDKPARLLAQLEPHVRLVSTEAVEIAMMLDHAAVAAVAGMGPSAHHVEAGVLLARVGVLPDPVRVSARVVVQTFRRRQGAS
jgi:23S rRNA (guanine745-N1)-methyltransferase